MIEAKTCLILGAGAGVPYGLPTGTELRDLILADRSIDGPDAASKFELDVPDKLGLPTFAAKWAAYLSSPPATSLRDTDKLQRFRDTFFRAKTLSIDKFLRANMDEFGELGKQQIAAVLLACEKANRLDKGWYAELFSQIAPDSPEDLKENALSIVTFNYDRSFELFFWLAFAATFNLTREATAEVFNKMEIVHAYGDLGRLDQVEYGQVGNVITASSKIELMRDGNCSRASDIRRLVENAENLCFIGFGFAPENVALFSGVDYKKKKILSTALGLSPNRQADAKKAVPGIKFFDMDAYQLLQNQDIFKSKARKEEPATPPARTLPVKRNWVTGGWKV